MKQDIILAGVGGQGVLSVAAIIAQAAANKGLKVRQSEAHGMAQRGGAVLAHLRISDGPIFSDLVPQGGADLIISMEPLESLRYAPWLSPEGALLSASEPMVNISDYPPLETIHEAIKKFPRHRLVAAEALAKEAGSLRSVNMVIVGAASWFLPMEAEILADTIHKLFGVKYPDMAETNRRAFELGRKAAEV